MTERHALRVVGMSASALRYVPRPDGNAELRQQIVDMAQRHRRYGAPMIYLKLRQAGQRINHKRVERLYALEKLQVRRRRRKKIPPADRQPLIRPGAANEVWSMDFVFDRIASGRALKCLAIVDDATHEAVAVIPGTASVVTTWCACWTRSARSGAGLQSSGPTTARNLPAGPC